MYMKALAELFVQPRVVFIRQATEILKMLLEIIGKGLIHDICLDAV